MGGLIFELRAPATTATPDRFDVACFVGFVRRRWTTRVVPSRADRAQATGGTDLVTWLDEQGWLTVGAARRADEIEGLLDLPVPIERWETFDRLFAWDRRPLRAADLGGGDGGGLDPATVLVATDGVDEWPAPGPAVAALASALQVVGYAGPFDGTLPPPLVPGMPGPLQAALVDLQVHLDMAPTGVLDPETAAALGLPAPAPPLDPATPASGLPFAASYLGAAVRSFFAEGGQKCYVVRVGSPWTLDAPVAVRRAALGKLLPGFPAAPSLSPADRGTWRGVRHLFGLPDVSMLCMPDLPDAVAALPPPPAPEIEPPPGREPVFVECSGPTDDTITTDGARLYPAPRTDESGFADWRAAVSAAARLLRDPANVLRDVALLAAVPLPAPDATAPVLSASMAGDPPRRGRLDGNTLLIGSDALADLHLAPLPARWATAAREGAAARVTLAEGGSVLLRSGRAAMVGGVLLSFGRQAAADLLGFLLDAGARPAADGAPAVPGALSATLDAGGLATAFVTLSAPWIRTGGSPRLPEGIEPPDGALVGLWARNALERGCYRSAAGQPLRDAYDVAEPASDASIGGSWDAGTQAGRISTVGRTVRGLELLSDVTTALDESYRPGHVSRLVAAVVRAARHVGEDVTFEVSSPATRGAVAARMRALLTDVWRAGGLRGERAKDAFDVRCDDSTMTDDDADNGRLIVEVELAPVAAVDRIRVVIALDESARLLGEAAA